MLRSFYICYVLWNTLMFTWKLLENLMKMKVARQDVNDVDPPT